MSEKTYLYRAVAIEHVENAYTDEPVAWPGSTIGRRSGYLSRSAAVNAGRESGIAFEVVRSEPVIFLTKRERLEREIAWLQAELDKTT